MCGQLGILLEETDRFPEQLRRLKRIFTDLLLLSEARGFHATGIATVNRDEEHRVYKQPLPAQEFVRTPGYRSVLSGLDSRTTLLMGHTRWKTKGTQHLNANNHPHRCRYTLGTHNGYIANADELFSRFKLVRRAQVDSEVIFRIADSAVGNSRIETEFLIERLSRCKGHMSAVISTWLDPETVLFIKGDRPLEFRYHAKRRVMVYASENVFLDSALAGERGWKDIHIPEMSMVTFDCRNLMDYRVIPFDFEVTGDPVPATEVRCG